MHSQSNVFSPEYTLADILALFRRGKRTILFCTLFALLVSSMIALIIPRQYKAETLIMLQNPLPANSSSADKMSFYPLSPGEAALLSEVEILRSRDLAEKVIAVLDLTQNTHFVEHPLFSSGKGRIAERVFSEFNDHLNVKPVMRSLVIAVSYRHRDPVLAAAITNELAKAYQQQQMDYKSLIDHTTNTWLEGRLQALSVQLRNSARAVEDYRQKENLTDDADSSLVAEQLKEMSSQLILAQADLTAALVRKNRLQDLIQNKETMDDFSEDAQSRTASLMDQERELKVKLAELQSRYGPRHPRVISAQAELSAILKRKDAETHSYSKSLDNDALIAQARVEAFQEEVIRLKQKKLQESRASIHLQELVREAEANRLLYETYLERFKQTDVSEDNRMPDSKIISAARVPYAPDGPPRSFLVILATLCGFILGTLIAALRDRR